MKKLILVGGGGHCASVADAAELSGEYDAIGIVDIKPDATLFGCIPFLGTDGDLPRLFSEGYRYAFITLGSIGDTSKREKLYQMVLDIGFTVPNIIDPTAVVSAHTSMDSGVFAGKNAVINAGAEIGACAIINTASVIEHDCQVGAFAHISPSATLCGNVRIGFGSHIGAGAIIKQGVAVGDHCTIGMGSVVTHDMPAGVVAYGNPCGEVRKNMTTLRNKPVYIIAEAGVNHNGSYELALQLIDAAKAAGADCIKFQTFKTESLVTKDAKKAEYQVANTHNDNSQYSMLKKLELTEEQYLALKKHCEDIGIDFLSTAFDFDSVDFLHSIGCSFWKIPSGEITNLPYLIKIAQYGEPVILSTGMATMDEVKAAVRVLRDYGCGYITPLHCTTEYPAPYQDVNLSAMLTMKRELNLPTGYSDHTKGITIPIAAVTMGAVVIEKHFTLDRNMDGPDHKASLEPDELKAMVEAIRQVEIAVGNGEKKPSESEKKNIAIARKSIVAKRRIAKGELLSEENITTKRPGDGISPMKWFDILGSVSSRDYETDEMIVE